LAKGDFIEIFIKADVSLCEKRDPKGLYKKARSGEIKEFTGVSAPYEEPLNAEIIVDTSDQNKEESAREILKYLIDNKYIV
ncbi:MAG: adenylyl-sulfate kinase, partial [Candidatus Omnitrophica bacterium]|nr:adenylyl-sulfate kinase [Candidatus Omnitrophota bacterium]